MTVLLSNFRPIVAPSSGSCLNHITTTRSHSVGLVTGVLAIVLGFPKGYCSVSAGTLIVDNDWLDLVTIVYCTDVHCCLHNDL